MQCAVWAQTIVFSLTAALVCWYTIETFRLRREMVRQNEIALRPVVVPEFDRSPDGLICKLRNIGAGAAFNESIEPVEIFRSTELGGELVFEVRFTPLPYLASGQTA